MSTEINAVNTDLLTSRRTFNKRMTSLLIVAGVAPAMLAVPVNSSGIGITGRLIWGGSKITPARLLAGMLFDVALGVVVELATDSVKELIASGRGYGGHSWRSPSSRRSLRMSRLENETDFTVNSYKASIVQLGPVDFEVLPRRAFGQDVFKLNYNLKADRERAENIITYLKDEKIAVKTVGMEYALKVKEIGDSFDAYQLLSVTRLTGKNMEEHYRNLIKITGTEKVFLQLT